MNEEIKNENTVETKQDIVTRTDIKQENLGSSKKNINEVDYEIIWEGQPAGLWDRFLSCLHLNFTVYQITKDELIVKEGFFRRRTNTLELYILKDPDLIETLVQRWLNVGNIYLSVDTHSDGEEKRKLVLKNVKDPERVRKILRDAIEADVMERKITYFDKV